MELVVGKLDVGKMEVTKLEVGEPANTISYNLMASCSSETALLASHKAKLTFK